MALACSLSASAGSPSRQTAAPSSGVYMFLLRPPHQPQPQPQPQHRCPPHQASCPCPSSTCALLTSPYTCGPKDDISCPTNVWSEVPYAGHASPSAGAGVNIGGLVHPMYQWHLTQLGRCYIHYSA